MTAAQVRDVITRLIEAGHRRQGIRPPLVVSGAGYDVTRLAFLLAGPDGDIAGAGDAVPADAVVTVAGLVAWGTLARLKAGRICSLAT